MEIAILGTGKMGSALAVGIACGSGRDFAQERKTGAEAEPKPPTISSKGARLTLCDHSHAKAAALARKIGAKAARTAKEATEGADAIIIAVKPDAVSALLEEIKKELGETLLISVVAGLPLSYFRKRVPKSCRIALIMPNLAVQVGKGATLYYAESHIDAREIEALLAPTGMVIRAKKEGDMDFAFLTSSGIAFFLAAIEGMAKAGEENGLSYSQSLALSAKAAEGSCALVLEKGIRPLDLERMVATEKGITMRGLSVLKKAKVQQRFHNAANAVIMEAKRRRRKNA